MRRFRISPVVFFFAVAASIDIAALLVAFSLLLCPAPALSASATANLHVSASIAQNCIIATATLPFGAYDPVVTNRSTALDQSTTMIVTCTKGAAGITMSLGPSTGTGTCRAPQRCLGSSTNTLLYQLYSDSLRTSVWTTAIAETVSGGITAPTAITIYGRVPGGQDASIGASYADTVVATVNY